VVRLNAQTDILEYLLYTAIFYFWTSGLIDFKLQISVLSIPEIISFQLKPPKNDSRIAVENLDLANKMSIFRWGFA